MNSSYYGWVDGSLIVAVIFSTAIMLIARAFKIKKILKSIDWRYVQRIAAIIVNILTITLYIVLLFQAIVAKATESDVSFTF